MPLANSESISQQNAIVFSELAYATTGTSAFSWAQKQGGTLPTEAAVMQAEHWTEWTANKPASDYSSTDGKNQFRVFTNSSSGDIVIAFQGSSLTQVLTTDLDTSDQGYSQWQSISSQLDAVVQTLESTFPKNDPIFTDGHSLGGEMAQLASLKYGYSGFAQNSLAIPRSPPTGVTIPPGILRSPPISGPMSRTARLACSFPSR